eukprot:CAMPEP_0119322832 /NCGR_PEP_ID=MMETSP1333-20130426/59307_1 /TAXON_ID=418940 /ORGANISM="Scyphosphaera apsteinii, Strain RCC1455" /LENGTH=491 /DNA_ID=CAMNT_0007330159 /DNA_START=161 /DNA_END=1636 /DNA_ORIENTATION=-
MSPNSVSSTSATACATLKVAEITHRRGTEDVLSAAVLHRMMEKSATFSVLSQLVQKKRMHAAGLFVLAASGILLMIAEVEIRLHREFDEPATFAIEVLKSVNVCTTAVCIALLIRYHQLDCEILLRCNWSLQPRRLFLIFQILMMLLGVIPPGVEASLSNPPLGQRIHIDALGVLMFVRIILLFLDWGMSFAMVSNPALISLRHKVEVRKTFQLKYFVIRRPLLLITFFVVSCWLPSAYVLHVFELPSVGDSTVTDNDRWPQGHSHFFAYLLLSWGLLSGCGWSGIAQVATIIGRAIELVLAVAGIVSVALLTATFCSVSALDASESALLGELEKRQLTLRRRQAAARLMQASFVRWRHRHRPNSSVRLRCRRTAIWGSTSAQLNVSSQLATQHVVYSQRKLKRYRMLVERLSESKVANIKVLQGEVRKLAADMAMMQESLSGYESDIKGTLHQLRRALKHGESRRQRTRTELARLAVLSDRLGIKRRAIG